MSIEEQNWKETVAKRALAAMRANVENDRRAALAACLENWRPYVLRRCPIRPTENREVIQDQVYLQIMLETVGVENKEAA